MYRQIISRTEHRENNYRMKLISLKIVTQKSTLRDNDIITYLDCCSNPYPRTYRCYI